MTINLSVPKEFNDLKPRITVVGVGGAGGNAVNNMIRANLIGCEFVACNTDAQALQHSLADRRIQLGQGTTRGLGAGSRPEVGRAAAEEAMEEIMQHLAGSNMVFITAGMGGGTGTGAAPVIARQARENGILTVGVITKPFHFEGTHRMRLAESGIEELQKFVDTLLIIPNQNLFRVANERTTFAEAFKMADNVLHAGVRGVTDLMVMPGLINLDFADIRAVMSEMGKAMMGTGEASGDKRAIDAAEAAISNPLLDDVSMKGARGVLINITGGMDMTLFEVDEAANRIREEVDPEANIIFGSTFDEKLEGKMRISVVATGIDAEVSRMMNAATNAALPNERPRPVPLHVVAATPAPAVKAPIAMPATPDMFPEAARAAGPQTIAGLTRTPSAGLDPAADHPALIQSRGFVAPRPVMPQQRVGTGAHAEAEPLSSARATQTREPMAKPKAPAPSLFQRIIGGGRNPPQRTQPSLNAPRQAPAAPPVARQPAPAATDPSGSEQDYLDIPAFLRRQAN
ncbi:MAG: cell division protein FtsZ [Aliidongia sp.]|jgi:cell division protein FtsZ|nr:cell division protein FtsZ [Aliidongia sp.]